MKGLMGMADRVLETRVNFPLNLLPSIEDE
jgi:hypothetical protein